MKRFKVLIILTGSLLMFSITGFVAYRTYVNRHGLTSKDYITKGRKLLFEKRYREAEDVLIRALTLDPDNIKAMGMLGTIYYRMGERDKALRYWKKALDRAPGDPILTGLIQSVEKNTANPAPLYHMSIQTVAHAPLWEQYVSQGQDLYLQGNYPEAVKAFNKAISLKPDPHIYFLLGATYLKMGRRDEVINAWEEALKLNPDDKMIKRLIEKVKRPTATDRQ